MAAEVFDRLGQLELDGEHVDVMTVMRDVEADRVWYHRLPIPRISISAGEVAEVWPTHEGRLSDFTSDDRFA